MIKQVYRFLSVFLISHLLFIQAGIAKPHKNPNTSTKSICQNKKDTNNKTNNKNPINKNSAKYYTLYGVIPPKEFYSTYTKPDQYKRYGVMNPRNIYNTYPLPDKQ